MDERPATSAPDDGASGAHEREHDADLREAALITREQAVAAKESGRRSRDQQNQAILVAADERDKRADKRDAAADARDWAASLDSFLHGADFSPVHKARLSAGIDRVDSKGDRTSAADDRSKLIRDSRERSELDDD